jgi:G:T-mismatch repair DNA endonuclease (very short patch repair protein)
METERDLQLYLKNAAKAAGVYQRKMVAVGHVGFPDILLAHRGRVVFVELKTPKGTGKLSEKQIREIGRLLAVGVEVQVIWQQGEVDELIREITRT